ncbi:hypothetical protein COV42_00750 [Candidatus Campbellbacteria bacterium CG11_big_fil_rev_8_21_14_0_20_44_21]|uniref:Baseplate protein J-like domain-containing protein n=1 Tax=Candidatus Campbellbacteria bacterium CG22_combo_CG10-13_8_21_14_all_43_18 TaxID=1974530 RepID=A0A2H0DX41_9BACT|nr:MAG: hypothetical protein COW82_00405 [Candidatus Campbellbacteria bacterium CG22_combo_CG10-13_8_21_14_all_43_18]PIR24434.1 MAG: hypothetical protein COV42_00750 [Candidatus Campbellbacteria bacterium CG11_big_fil_rev_8_21_14_0_20_44_21]
MPDKPLQDVVSGSGRSIRRIPLSSRESKPTRKLIRGGPIGKSSDLGSGNFRRARESRFGIWFLAASSVLVLFLVLSAFFSGTKVKITPKQEDVFLNGSFTAFEEPQSGELKFNLMTVTREASAEAPAVSEEFVSEKAFGEIIIYNNYSSAGQRLIADTRFETPTGLIYRIKNAVNVPGRKTTGGETVPGSLSVKVYADETGEEYNIALSDFTIPGLKGDPRYGKFYARSKTPMTGGMEGNVKKTSPEELQRVSADLEKRLQAEILTEAMSEKPEGFVLLPGAYLTKSQTETSGASEESVFVTEKVTLLGIIFDENDFAEFAARSAVSSYDNLPVEIKNYDGLKFVLLDKNYSGVESAESIDFSLDGNAKIIWKFDEDSLIKDLLGQPKKRLDSILSKYPSIEGAKIIPRPFWKRSVDDNPNKVKIEIVLK